METDWLCLLLDDKNAMDSRCFWVIQNSITKGCGIPMKMTEMKETKLKLKSQFTIWWSKYLTNQLNLPSFSPSSNLPLLRARQATPIVVECGRCGNHLQGDSALVLWTLEELLQTSLWEGHLSQVLHSDLGECESQEWIRGEAIGNSRGNYPSPSRVEGSPESFLFGEFYQLFMIKECPLNSLVLHLSTVQPWKLPANMPQDARTRLVAVADSVGKSARWRDERDQIAGHVRNRHGK